MNGYEKSYAKHLIEDGTRKCNRQSSLSASEIMNISQSLFEKLLAKGVKLVTGMRANMKNRLMELDSWSCGIYEIAEKTIAES